MFTFGETGNLTQKGLLNNVSIITTLLTVLMVAVSYSIYIHIMRKKMKRINDERMKSIREAQIKKWENETRYSNLFKDKSDENNKEDNADNNIKKSKMSKTSISNNSHLNPHFSYLSTYRPSVSKRYPCKKCCG